MAERKKLGELLLGKGLIDEIQLRSGMAHQKNWGGKIGSALVELGFISTGELAKVLEEQLRYKCLSESEMVPEPEALALMNARDAVKYVALPLRIRGNEVLMALSNPHDLAMTDEIGFKLGKRVRGVLAVESTIKNAIKKYYGGTGGREYKVEAPFSEGLKIEPAADVKEQAAPAAPVLPEHQSKDDPLARALAYLLIEKGIITKEELQIRLNFLKTRP